MQTDDVSTSIIPGPNRCTKYFVVEEEKIVFKPSVALLPDEYQHKTAESIHIFRIDGDRLLDCHFDTAFKKLEYKIYYYEITTEKQFTNDLDLVKKISLASNSVFIIFLGFYKERGSLFMPEEQDALLQNVHIKTVWNRFICQELESKPKTFIFAPSKIPLELVAQDIAERELEEDEGYDFPAESDILMSIRFDLLIEASHNTLKRLCTFIGHFGDLYDIVDLLTLNQIENDPIISLIISTFTRKLYLVEPEKRKNIQDEILKENKQITNKLNDLKDYLKDLSSQAEEKNKNKTGCFNLKSFRKKSFRKQSEERSLRALFQ